MAVGYAYFNDDSGTVVGSSETGTGGSHAPILIIKCQQTGALFADVCMEKGAHPWSVDCLVRHILWLGHSRVKLRSDGERPIRALCEKATEELKKKGVSVVPDFTPVGDSVAGGLHESAVHVFKTKCRILWQQARELHGVTQSNTHGLLPWVAMYAAQLVTRSHKDDNGRTAWSHVTGRRDFNRPFVPWGEKSCIFLAEPKANQGLHPNGSKASFWHSLKVVTNI